MISERMLRKWRKEALQNIKYIRTKAIEQTQVNEEIEDQNRILRMTQELLDQHLLSK